MSIFFAATSLADFQSRNTSMGFTSNTGELRPYLQEGYSMGDGAATNTVFPSFSHGVLGDELWLHCYLGGGSGANHDVEWRILDSLDNFVYRIVFDNGSSGGIRVDIWNGAAWNTTINTTTNVRDSFIDVQIVNGLTTGAVRLYVSGTLDQEVTGINTNLGTSTDIGGTELQAPSTSGGDSFFGSEFLITDENTLGWLFVQEDQTGEVINTMGSGGFSEVSDQPGLDTATFAQGDTDGQKLTFAGTFSTVIDTAHEVVAVVTSVNATKIGNVVSGLKALDVISSTEYTSTEVPLDTGTSVTQFIQPLSPVTGIAWTPAEVQASEAGIETA